VPRLATILTALLVAAAALAPAASAAPPPNDARAAATPLGPPAGVQGTTAESTLEAEESASVDGADVAGSVWYTFRTSTARRVVVRLQAAGALDAGVEVYRRARSQLPLEQSVLTDEDGSAVVFFDSRAGATYYVRVAQRANSAAGTFTLNVDLPRLFPSAPGAPLPKAGVTGRVDGLVNAADAYSTVLKAGVTYRVNLANLSEQRLFLTVYGPGTSSFADERPIRSGRSYVLITPRPEDAGRYSFVVSASRVTSRQSYRLRVGRAGRDDRFPGLVLPDQRRVRGSLNAAGIDAVDVYRFDILHRSTVQLNVGTAERNSVDLRLETAGGRRVAQEVGVSGGHTLIRTLQPGRYVLQLRARGVSRGRYTLRRVTRTFTRLTIGGGGTVAPGAAVTLRLGLQPGESGPARVTIERFDPFGGWLFAKRVATTISGGSGAVVFRPPTIGRWRARAEFLGTRSAEDSETRRDAHFEVVTPLSP
jgi:hypothetical protein